jgi:hypothetical protein
MKMEKKWRLIVIFTLAVLVIGVTVFALFYFPKERVTSGNLQLNKSPQFVIGQSFSYVTKNRSIGGGGYYFEEDIFMVNGTRKIDNREYFEVVRNFTAHVIESCPLCPSGTRDTTNNRVEIFYYDVEDGTCIGKTVDPVKFSNEDFYATDVAFFAYWMLGLEEGVKWEMNEDSLWSYKFEVLGIEEVKGISCFKVKVQVISQGTLQEIRNYWIDCERRIMIEEEIVLGRYEGKLYKYIVEP